jgi:hypothetical protein
MHERSPWQTPYEVNKLLIETYKFIDETYRGLGESVNKRYKHIKKERSRRLTTLGRKQNYLLGRLKKSL